MLNLKRGCFDWYRWVVWQPGFVQPSSDPSMLHIFAHFWRAEAGLLRWRRPKPPHFSSQRLLRNLWVTAKTLHPCFILSMIQTCDHIHHTSSVYIWLKYKCNCWKEIYIHIALIFSRAWLFLWARSFLSFNGTKKQCMKLKLRFLSRSSMNCQNQLLYKEDGFITRGVNHHSTLTVERIRDFDQ